MAPLQTELHRHLDVSTRPSTLLEILKAQGDAAQSTSLEAFKKKVCIREPMGNLETVLAQFTVFQKALMRPENLERIAYETLEDCVADGTRKVELRFSPSFVCEHSELSWDEALDAFERGLKKALAKFPDVQAGFLCIASRDYGVDVVDETVEFFLKHRTRFAGFDLAGNETEFPCRLFEQPFKKLRAAGAKITIHAGE
ncbi:MAG: adenosine deaminase, partial [Bdellovibrionota bacterium]